MHKKWLKTTLLGKAIVSLSLDNGQTFVRHYQGLKTSYRLLSLNICMFWKASTKSTLWWFSPTSWLYLLFISVKRLKGIAQQQNRIRACALAGHIQLFHEMCSCVKHLQLGFLLVNCLWQWSEVLFFISLLMTTSCWIFYTFIRQLQTHACFSVSSARLFHLQK